MAVAMKIYNITDNQIFPFLMIDDFFDEEVLKSIWNELNFYEGKTYLETEIIAQIKGKPMGTVKRLYLDKIYAGDQRHISDILSNYQKRLWSAEIVQAYKKTVPSWVTFWSSNKDTTQLGYMENSDYYTAHFDVTQHTALVWLYKEPRKFKGGDLIFTQSKINVECRNNRMVLFPSYYFHAVSKLEMNKEDMGKGYGRWVLTNFSCHV